MADARELMKTVAAPDGSESESAPEQPTKEELQHRMEDARESISQTVGEIRDTVEDQYAAVKATVGGILDWREGFRGEPILWSVGALSAGFAFGYTLGVTKKRRIRSGGKVAALDSFATRLIQELTTATAHLPLDTLDPHVRSLFGFGFSDLLAEIGTAKKATRRSKPAKKQAKQPATRRRVRARARRRNRERD